MLAGGNGSFGNVVFMLFLCTNIDEIVFYLEKCPPLSESESKT